jgi:hypothetical protein
MRNGFFYYSWQLWRLREDLKKRKEEVEKAWEILQRAFEMVGMWAGIDYLPCTAHAVCVFR